MADLITGLRILISAALIFCPALSPAFFVLYIAAGLSDMLDGAVARRTGTASESGARLDTLADIVFAAVCLIKLLPVLDIPSWIYVWIACVALIKAINIAVGYARRGKLPAVHSAANRITGAMLFVLPVTLTFLELIYSAPAVCAAATFAAVQEGYIIIKDRDTK